MTFYRTCYVLVLLLVVTGKIALRRAVGWVGCNHIGGQARKIMINLHTAWDKVAAEIGLWEYFDTSFSHLPKLTTSPTSTCNENEMRDICFWENTTFEVPKGNKAKKIGTIGPPHDPQICNIRNVSYNVFKGTTDVIKLYPPDAESRFWTVGADPDLIQDAGEAKLMANISCSLITPNGEALFAKIVEIAVDTGPGCSSVPKPQDAEKIFLYYSPRIKKGDTVDNLLFLDTVEANTYQVVMDKETSEFLAPNCTYLAPDGLENRQGKIRTVIHCQLTVTRPRTLKNQITFLLGLRNTNAACSEEKYTGYMNITFRLEKKRIKRSNVFSNNSKVFRTAAPYARVTQPVTHTKSMTNYHCNVSNVTKNPFAITTEGIVYVNDTHALRKTPESLSLNITWTKNNIIQYEEISVRIVEEPSKTCTSLETEDSWHICAAFESSKTCLKKTSCGLGTGGMTSVQTRSGPQRCMWRGDKNPDNHETHLYSTCSSDTKFCPDGYCDSLEILQEDYLCPQDCTKNAVIPARLSPTGRGVDKCNGVLVCDMSCTCALRMATNESLIGKMREDKLIGTKKQEENSCGMECILLATGGVALVIFVLFLSVVLWRTIRMKTIKKDKYMENLTEAETPFSDYIERNVVSNEPLVLNFHMSTNLDNNSSNTLKAMKVDSKWKFPRQQIFIEQILGEGEFGKVLKAKAFNIAGKPGYSLVAVKTLKDDARKQDYNDLFSEYQLLKEVNHPHVIQLLGVCPSEDGPLYLIIEYAVFGSLRNYLRRSRHILTATELGHIEDNLTHKVTARDVLSCARQIASGMSYLSDIKLVHRDLAARNILLAENKVCKISDFGLTRDIYEDNAYFKKSKGRVPVKWMAPESLADHVYTTKSDVWSFGILIWEVITLGASPYPGIPVHNLYNLLKHGYRMERPPNCSTVLYSLMNRCWYLDPDERPSFLELYHCFDNLLTDNVNYLDLSDNAIINKSYFTNFAVTDVDSGCSDLLGEKINFLKHNLYKDGPGREEKLPNLVEGLKEPCVGYETPVKNPRPVLTPSSETPGEYTDMTSKDI